MKKWEKCKTCAMDKQCENQDKNFECKYPYKFVSGRKFLKDVEYYKKLKNRSKRNEIH